MSDYGNDVNNRSFITYRRVEKDDIPQIKALYNEYVQTSTATFHYEPRTEIEMAVMLLSEDAEYLTESWIVFYKNEMAGYAYFTPYKKREAYKCSAEATLYLKPEMTGKGIGKTLLAMMEKRAKEAGIHTLMAVICGENTASIALFEKSGYEKCAHLKEVGRKFDRLLDVVMYQKML